jgi:hypothetical protein
MRISGFDFPDHNLPPTSEILAAAFRPYIATAIELFGAERCMFGCMFESNFPIDKGGCSYPGCFGTRSSGSLRAARRTKSMRCSSARRQRRIVSGHDELARRYLPGRRTKATRSRLTACEIRAKAAQRRF